MGSLLAPAVVRSPRRTAANAALEDSSSWQQYLPIGIGVVLLVVLILNQNGVAERVDALARRHRGRIPGLRPGAPEPLPAAVRTAVPARAWR